MNHYSGLMDCSSPLLQQIISNCTKVKIHIKGFKNGTNGVSQHSQVPTDVKIKLKL